MPNFRNTNNCYRMLIGLDDIGRTTWASSLEHLYLTWLNIFAMGEHVTGGLELLHIL